MKITCQTSVLGKKRKKRNFFEKKDKFSYAFLLPISSKITHRQELSDWSIQPLSSFSFVRALYIHFFSYRISPERCFYQHHSYYHYLSTITAVMMKNLASNIRLMRMKIFHFAAAGSRYLIERIIFFVFLEHTPIDPSRICRTEHGNRQ